MPDLLLNPLTESELTAFSQNPAHALLLTAPAGSGKLSTSIDLGSKLLGIDKSSFQNYAYARVISSGAKNSSIGIEAVRELEHILSLKVPSRQSINRIIIIENSHLLTIEAQNALLKTIEEPPTGTVVILTAISAYALLPTIRSRMQHIELKQPDAQSIENFFLEQGFERTNIKRTLAMSGGLIGLSQAILNDSEHPLLKAAVKARELLGASTFERLVKIDELVQSKTFCADTLFMMQQMALISLRSSSGTATLRWERILKASYQALQELQQSAQVKLLLTNFYLNI